MGKGGSNSCARAQVSMDAGAALGARPDPPESLLLSQLPEGLGHNQDLRDQLEARYGGSDDSFRFARQQLDIKQLDVADLEFYQQLAAQDSAIEQKLLAEGFDPDELVEEAEERGYEFSDGEERLRIVLHWQQRLAAGEPLLPAVVVREEGAWHILDGYHRLAGARAAGLGQVPVYVLLED